MACFGTEMTEPERLQFLYELTVPLRVRCRAADFGADPASVWAPYLSHAAENRVGWPWRWRWPWDWPWPAYVF